MRLDLEEKFIKDFINNNYQERILFELKSSKKRIHGVLRFCHNTEELIKKECIYKKLKSFDENEFVSFFQGQDVYVISYDYIDGVMMSSNEIIKYLYEDDCAVIAFRTNIAIIKKEYEKGYDNFFLLKKINTN